MRAIERLQRGISTPYFGLEQAAVILGGTGLPSKVSRMVRNQELLQLKRGFFVFGEEYRRNQVELFPIANLLYGPSYVSLESALSFYSFIPEALSGVTSITPKRVKQFDTALGRFLFRVVKIRAFGAGVVSLPCGNSHALIATPEKALLDKLYLDAPGEDLWDYCIHSLRIEGDTLTALDTGQLRLLAEDYGVGTFLLQVMKFAEKIEKLRV